MDAVVSRSSPDTAASGAAWPALVAGCLALGIVFAAPLIAGVARVHPTPSVWGTTGLALFAGGVAVALNVIPGVLAPLIRVSRLPVGGAGVLRYVAAHLTVTFASGALGFVSVLTVREVLRAVLGPTLFQRASAPVQGGLVVLLATSLLLLPGQAAGVDGRWVSATEAFAMPPVWFVGLHETLAGDGLANVTATRVPADAPARMSLEAHEARMIGRYRVHQPILRQLGGVALRALAVVFAIAAVACAWNNRRLPQLTIPHASGRGRFRAAGARLVHRALVPDPLGQAGFVFTLQTLARSVPHRVAVAVTCGAAFAAAAVSLNRTDMAGGATQTPPLAAFAMQTWVLVILVGGFRYATRVPADVRGTTTFVLARARSDHAFLTGVKRAGIVGVGCPAILLLVPAHLVLMGPLLATAHALLGVLILGVLLELWFVQARGLPFVAIYEAPENAIAGGVVAAVAALLFVWAVASWERAALADGAGGLYMGAGLIVLWVLLVALNRRTPTSPGILDPDTLPAGATQALVLND